MLELDKIYSENNSVSINSNSKEIEISKELENEVFEYLMINQIVMSKV